MLKKIISISLALLLIAVPAMAEVFAGTTAARNRTPVVANAGGTIEELYIQPGLAVKEGETIARLRTTKVFATQNGTVARIHAKEGKEVQGTVLEIAPVSRYIIHCTADGAYDSAASMLVHCGEELYLYCTKNGTHQGCGRVYSLDNETYMVEATAGEFYVGETVYLYRDPDYSSKQRVGIGTVLASATEVYEDEGRITAIHVSEGEYVEKGELLYELIQGEGVELNSPAGGIITACEAGKGTAVSDGQTIASLVPYDEICIAVQVDESMIGRLSVGDSAKLRYCCDLQERLISGQLIEISEVVQDGCYTVYISPEETPAQLGLSVEVWLD